MTTYYRRSRPLQCFDHTRYFLTLDENDDQCIALTRQGLRCRWDISKEEVDEVVNLTAEANGIASGNERHNILQRLVLLRTCGDSHRQKLEANPDCLSKVAEMYEEKILTSPIALVQSARIPQGAGQSETPRSYSPVMVNRKDERRHRYLLRPRLFSTSTVGSDQQLSDPRQQCFVPYASGPTDHIDDVLVSDIPSAYALTGQVYAFTWPSSPEFVKIGYTGISVPSRMSRWQQCHPGATLLHSVDFPFPQRMERLIHLQLSPTRHQIIICTYCSGTHFEWFRISTDVAIQTMNAWKAVTEREELYTSARELSKPWQKRIASVKDRITAQGLRDILETEANLEIQSRAPSVDLIEVRTREDSVIAGDKAGPLCQRTDNILSKKSYQQDWDTVLTIFSDFVRMVTI